MKDIFGRFTPDKPDEHSLDTLIEFLKNYSNKYVVSYETDAKRPHYHFAIFNVETSTELLRTHFKSKYKPGQLYLSGKNIIDKIKTIAYTIKDGLFKSNGLDVNDFLMASVIARPKVKYDNLMKDIEDEYLKGSLNDKQLVSKILDAYLQTNKKIYIQHIKASALLIKLKKESNKSKRDLLIERIIEDL